MKRFLTAIFLLLLLGAGASAYVAWDLREYAMTPSGGSDEKTVFTVPAGQGFLETRDALDREGLIQSPVRFGLLARLRRADTRIRAGEYLLSPAMTPEEILDILVAGRVRHHKLTIPEGYTMHQIAEAAQAAGLVREAAFLAAAADPDTVREFSAGGATLEGYLFPDTYHFTGEVTAEAMVRTMVRQFWSVFTPGCKARAGELGLTVHETVTLASIIERETGAPEERALISSVFHNRLKKGMRLESDPTVIYGIADFDGNLTRKHLEDRTPYNTYRISGLPPGPIANPGREALHAALHPAETEYLFFVSKQDRTHQFSTNLKDHNRAVRKYQLLR